MITALKRALVLAVLCGLSLPASAQWVAGGGYVQLSEDVFEDNLRLQALYGSIGYQIDVSDNLSYMPELRIATGISDDFLSAFGVDFELDYFIAFGVRAQYEFDSGAYLYAVPSYGRVKLTAEFGPFDISEGDSEFGIGAGAGYKFSERVWGELSFEDFDGTDTLSLGFRYAF